MIHADLVRKTRRIIAAQPCAAIGIDTDAKVSHARFELGAVDDGGECRVDVEVCLCGRGFRRVGGVVEGDEEDVGDDWGGGGAACEKKCWKRLVNLQSGGLECGREGRGLHSRMIAMTISIIRI